MPWNRPYIVLPVMAAALALGAWGCDKEVKDEVRGPGTGPGKVVQFPGRAECPDHGSFIAWRGDTSSAFSQVALAGAATLIPEFHDCQRLIDTDHQFGPLVGIWVPEYLPTVLDSLPDLETAIPVAIVHAWDDVYQHLDIAQKWNCLYLLRKPGADGEFRAKMIHVNEESDCAGKRPASELHAPYLEVTRVPISGLSLDDYPAAGRWDRDRHAPKHFIGLSCGAAWCEISRGAHGSSRRYSLNLGAAPKKRRVLEVKGWYDEQYLAVPTDPPGGWQPLQFLGTIVPDANLQDRQLSDFEGVWVPAGTVTLEEESDTYRTKLHISPGSLPSGYDAGANLTKVSLCQETSARTCRFQPATDKPACGGGADQWYARTEEPGSVTKYHYKCVTRHDHSGFGRPIPGTARWSWKEDDETQWWRCAQGCCTVKP